MPSRHPCSRSRLTQELQRSWTSAGASGRPSWGPNPAQSTRWDAVTQNCRATIPLVCRACQRHVTRVCLDCNYRKAATCHQSTLLSVGSSLIGHPTNGATCRFWSVFPAGRIVSRYCTGWLEFAWQGRGNCWLLTFIMDCEASRPTKMRNTCGILLNAWGWSATSESRRDHRDPWKKRPAS